MRKFMIILIIVLLLLGVFYLWHADLFPFGKPAVSDVNPVGDIPVDNEFDDYSDVDNFPHKAFPRFYDLGEPDMVLDGYNLNSDGNREVWHVYGVDPDRENRLDGIKSLDYKMADYFLCIPDGMGNEYHAADEFCSYRTWRVLLRNLDQRSGLQEERSTWFEVTHYGDELSDAESLALYDNDKFFEVVDFRFGGIGYFQVKNRVWSHGELKDNDYITFTDHKEDLYEQAIAYWDGVSESIIMYTNDPSMPGSDVIIHLYDFKFDPRIPDYLFEIPDYFDPLP